MLSKQNIVIINEFDIDEIVQLQQEDPSCNLLKKYCMGSIKILNTIPSQFIKDLDSIHINANIIYFANRPVVNLKLVEKAVKVMHFSTHAGITDIRRRIKSLVYCHNTFSIIENIVGSYNTCLTMRKLPNKLYVSFIRASHLRQIGSFDLCHVNGETIIVLVDHFFNYMYAQVIPG